MNPSAIKRILLIGIMFLGIAASAISCSTSSTSFAVAQLDKDRLEASNVNQDDLKRLVADNIQFACDLYDQLVGTGFEPVHRVTSESRQT